MKKKYDTSDMIFAIFMTFMIGMLTGGTWQSVANYKEGQRDALNGKYKYEYRIDTVFKVDSTLIKK